MDKACIHLYTGDGKGKSTAGIGLCTRAAGAGLRVGFFQFLKSGQSSEISSLKSLNILVEVAVCDKFIWNMNDAEKAQCAKRQQDVFSLALKQANTLDLLVMDEAISATDCGFLPRDALLAFMQDKPQNLELVLTGRGNIEELSPYADYVTEMRLQKHPYESEGLGARLGIEY